MVVFTWQMMTNGLLSAPSFFPWELPWDLVCMKYWHHLAVMHMRRREDGIPRLVINVDHRNRHRDSSSTSTSIPSDY
ncbi:hypothetical protein DAPPUDRAFT_237624 [Daphnia pulex]|uniref:Uncharacterized protein n=1 Tax=Daphnia pulex TaxID=6669 RepID=E9G5E0_DAPPU|nr:hypothetical protein DAPPUDRAFT_237624 [Daphnia pulex]|eukprot:EFX85192.1 hypothetical protein DAPPUDRAFT_237624 [Daphnia pulex]